MPASPGGQPLPLVTLFIFLSLSFFQISPVFGYIHGHRHRDLHHAHSKIRRQGEDQSSSMTVSLADSTASGQNDYTCGPNKPCSNGACCGEDGWCGYSPNYCGGGCQSNCDAKAECGQYAKTPGQTCPLNVCCSQHGFCGTTTDFCGDGCQSNCDTSKPNASPSNPQEIVIGYWETWNMDKPCGTMGPGEIPVELLTHLFVSFGYINSAFEVTNMDGIDPSLYKAVGNTKARNPNLKIVIALGGWTFSDPGPWQDKFPSLAATKASRTTFINNLLGFLSEYGYDGVDFDWEYPGAEDRGGTEVDGQNYVALMKELREAINASGHDYIITFTAPSSYWYLRHFDLKGMETYVDWINLMSYDLHGVWDSENPIGSQVLAHTNLTEIDSALDLFWRVGVEPSSIVLGLGFYGRSFELKSASCWKPGCTFKGPGSPGRCSKTAGILSYAEIMEIVENTGGTPYFDEAAAARYMVYDDHSWISFDDAETFQMKIDYASRMGLRGLMIWAIDLDTPNLEALRAISKRQLLGSTNAAFSLVDLERIFPSEMLPGEDAETNYALISFGGNSNNGQIDPNESGFGFVLITGSSAAVASLKKRQDEPDPAVFIECPKDVLHQPKNQTQTARIVCLTEDVEGCFQIMKRGVEGTIVEMPENCAHNSLARAISLKESEDQSLPSDQHRRAATSKVFDFEFDLNLNKSRRDTGETQMRVDYSNVKGYWNAAVDSPGIQSGSSLSRRIVKRFFAEGPEEWRSMYKASETAYKTSGSGSIDEKIDNPMFWGTAQDCKFDDEEFDIGFGAHVGGSISADFTYGFSMIASVNDVLDVKQANGWLNVKGSSDLTYSIAGVGEVDFSETGKGNPATGQDNMVKLKGHTLVTGGDSEITFQPYWQFAYMVVSANNEEDSDDVGATYFDGKLSTRIRSDFGGFDVNFPPNSADKRGTNNEKRSPNAFSLDNSNAVYSTGGGSGNIGMGAFFKFGLLVDLTMFYAGTKLQIRLADITQEHETRTEWEYYPAKDATPRSCVRSNVITVGYQKYEIDDERTIGWPADLGAPATISDTQYRGGDDSCYNNQASMGNELLWGDNANNSPGNFMDAEAAESLESSRESIQCKGCVKCGKNRKKSEGCCGCIDMDAIFGYSDILCDDCFAESSASTSLSAREELRDDQNANHLSHLEKRAYQLNTGAKPITVCPGGAGKSKWTLYGMDYKYPQFPSQDPDVDFENLDGQKWRAISRYWGNSSISCSNWDVEDLMPHDTRWLTRNGVLEEVRGIYETEHVFEGQLIGNFFTQWLNNGAIKNQIPAALNPQPKVPCTWTHQWILSTEANGQDFPWKLDGSLRPFIDLLMAELGNVKHLDRLTIFKGRSNGVKGGMFRGNAPVSLKAYAKKSAEEKLLTTKEIGMVFEYMNDAVVWKKFCNTYEALYELFGDFDTFYANFQGAGVAIPSLQTEWKEFIETVLTSMVNRAKTSFQLQSIMAFGGILPSGSSATGYLAHWAVNMAVNQGKIRIGGTCPHLDAIDNNM